MPRIPIPSKQETGAIGRLMHWVTKRRYGAVLEPGAVLARHGGVLASWSALELVSEKGLHDLPASLRDIVQFRVATTIGCSWCVDFGGMLQLKSGEDTERLSILTAEREYENSPRFSTVERKALAYADAMTAQPPEVTDDQVSELDALLGHRGLIELTFAIAVENLRGRTFNALGITDQGFTSGDACRVPNAG